MRLLVVVAVEAEAEAVRAGLARAGTLETDVVRVAGIGRVNAALAVAEAVHRGPAGDVVLSAGVAGRLPGAPEALAARGTAAIATRCVYAEEGIELPGGFADVRGLGFPLGDFEGNAVPVDAARLAAAPASLVRVPIATVATCSGTDAAADRVAARTGAALEAMEGAAVVHAARRFGLPGAELRCVSNDTGARDRQDWDLPAALAGLERAISDLRVAWERA